MVAPANGWIESSGVTYGTIVRPDDLLAQLDSELQTYQLDEAKAKVESLDAQLSDAQHGARNEEIAVLRSRFEEQQFAIDEAELELERLLTLRSKDLATKADYDKAVLNLKALQAASQVTQHQIEVQMLAARPDYLDSISHQIEAAQSAQHQAEWTINQRAIKSKITAKVKEIYARKGEYVTLGQPIMLLQLTQTTKVRFYIPQNKLSSIQLGQEVRVSSDSNDVQSLAKISYISQRAEFTPPVLYSEKSREDLVFLIEAHFDKAVTLTPGQPVDVTIP
ncbi:HlyD family secretion protein [Glaciecola sp. 1036]|uniref:HlyD family secretion protein n=1 Tax=Alteromonadaceae TaxID=72275 RepID=UPI003D01EB79